MAKGYRQDVDSSSVIKPILLKIYFKGGTIYSRHQRVHTIKDSTFKFSNTKQCQQLLSYKLFVESYNNKLQPIAFIGSDMFTIAYADWVSFRSAK